MWEWPGDEAVSVLCIVANHYGTRPTAVGVS